MENQGTRDSLPGQTRAGSASGGTGSPDAFGGGADRTGTTSNESRIGSGTAGMSVAGVIPEPVGVQGWPGAIESQGQPQMDDQSSAGGAREKMDAGIDMAAGGIDKLVGAIRDRGQQMEGSSGAAGTVGSVATTAADKLEGASQYLHQTDTDRLIADLEGLIRRKPAESLLVAAGIGFVLAKALR